MNQLFINGKLLQLSSDTIIATTFAANNIGELQKRQSSFSNTFQIPINQHNIEALEWSNVMTSTTELPYKQMLATYIEDGVEVFTDGIAIIESVDEFFNVAVVSGNIDLMNTIGDITVGDLYVNDVKYNWTRANAFNYRDKTNYFIYPLIDWRKDIDTFFTTTTIDVREMIPCALISGMFTRLSNYTGFNFTGNYLTSNDFVNKILTPNNFNTILIDSIITSQRLTAVMKTGIVGGMQVPNGTGISSKIFYPDFRNENAEQEFYYGDFRPSQNKIGTLAFSGEYQIKWEWDGSGNKIENTKDCWVVARFKDDLGTLIKEVSFDRQTKSKNDSPVLDPFVIAIETPEMTFLSSRIYHIELEVFLEQKNVKMNFILFDYPVVYSPSYGAAYAGTPVGFFTGTNTNVFTHFMSFDNTDKIAFGSPMNFKDLFTMKVKDVLKDILNMNGIIMQTNSYKKEVQFNVFEDVKKNMVSAKDWSKKWTKSTGSLSFTFGNYSQKNYLRFKEDSDKDMNAQDLFDSYFTLTNENLDTEKTVVQLNHPSTVVQLRYANYPIPKINELEDINNGWLNNDWRLLDLKLQQLPFSIDYYDGVGSDSSSYNIPFVDFKSMSKIISLNYQTLISILDKTKVINESFSLTPVDIFDLDFSKPIYLNIPSKNLDGYFYLNLVRNYVSGNNTICELIRL